MRSSLAKARIHAFDVRDRLATLKPKLLVPRGMDDPTNPPEYEKEIHDAVPGSRYVTTLCHPCQRPANCVATTASYLTSPSSVPTSRANLLMCSTISAVMVGS